MKLFLHHLCLISLLAFSVCQNANELDTDAIKKQLNDNIPGLENFNTTNLPSEEEVERLIKEKCEKNGGGEEAFNALKNQQTELKECVESHINATVIQEEVEEAKKTGSMDEVFGKYCKKYPEVYQCVETLIEKVKPCLDSNEHDTMNKTLKIVAELKEFICFKDGDRIAMFIAEGGVECMESRKEQLQECANRTLGSRIPTDMNVNSLPTFLFTQRECDDFDKVRNCFNVELEKCKDSTPANIVDAFFKFLKKHMPCDSIVQGFSKEKESGGSSKSQVVLPSFVLGVVLLSKFL